MLRSELGIEAPKSNTDWACNGIKQSGQLADGSKYNKHGFGCAIRYSTGAIDFDFGANGELDGFDASRLWRFSKASKRDYGFATEKEIFAEISEAVSRGKLRFSGYMLYYVNAKNS
ncbi:MAG: hypothetical protein Q8N18_06105 [Opitutaceae bacterium]|nr:hypothetical protein [Opitutaceae bacterium]